jgi:predicted adenylyl cyclase CyaB
MKIKLIIYALAFTSCLINAGKEIELKISIPADIRCKLEEWLRINAQYLGETEQKEYYVTSPHEAWDYSAGFKDTLKTMRIRQEASGDSFCYKYRHLDPITKKTTHRDEYETKVACGAVMLEIVQKLGYTDCTMVYKKRRSYLVRSAFEIVFDDVVGVGQFVEIELKESVDNVRSGIELIENLLKELGIYTFKQYDRGYIHMIWNPGYEFGSTRVLVVSR